MDLLNTLALLAADTGPGRGDDPSGGTGIAIILVIAGLVLMMVVGGLWLASRGRKRSEMAKPDTSGQLEKI